MTTHVRKMFPSFGPWVNDGGAFQPMFHLCSPSVVCSQELVIIKEVIYLKFRRVLPVSQSGSTCIKICLIMGSCSRSGITTYCVKP